MFSGLLKTLFSTENYKAQQGRLARRSTFIGLALVFILGAWRLYSTSSCGAAASPIIAAIVALVGVWCSYRIVNYRTFADFLVSVEAEMAKVSWPSKKDLFANTKVVLVFMFLFTLLIYVYDLIFRLFFGLVN